MAECFDEDDFWLPPQFLADDDNMLDKNTCATNKNNHQNCLTSSPFHSEPACFPFEFGNFGVFSDFSSPLESLKGSSETERDEEDCGPGLTLRMARSTIDDVGFNSNIIPLFLLVLFCLILGDLCFLQERVLSESPQSTLCDMESGSGGSQVSSCGSPERNCKVQSPPATWDLLHAVAEEVASMRMNESHVVLPQNGATSQVSVPVKNSTTGTGFYQKLDGPQVNLLTPLWCLNHSVNWGFVLVLNWQSILIPYWIHILWQFQHLQQKQNHPMVENGVRGWKGLSPSAWLPPRRGSGRRTLFPGTQGGIRESAGTGVFLPRHTNTQADERRKPGSYVLSFSFIIDERALNYQSSSQIC